MTTETDSGEGPLERTPAVPAPRKTWREQRWERRRRRRFHEELLGWILVPLIVLGCYWVVDATLGALGTSPGALIQGIQTINEQPLHVAFAHGCKEIMCEQVQRLFQGGLPHHSYQAPLHKSAEAKPDLVGGIDGKCGWFVQSEVQTLLAMARSLLQK